MHLASIDSVEFSSAVVVDAEEVRRPDCAVRVFGGGRVAGTAAWRPGDGRDRKRGHGERYRTDAARVDDGRSAGGRGGGGSCGSGTRRGGRKYAGERGRDGRAGGGGTTTGDDRVVELLQ